MTKSMYELTGIFLCPFHTIYSALHTPEECCCSYNTSILLCNRLLNLKTNQMKKIFIILLSAAAITSCKKDVGNNNKAETFKGPELQVYSGKAWTTIQTDEKGSPNFVMITVDDNALNSLPVGEDKEGAEFTLQLNGSANIAPFNHVALDWNPHGHEPTGIYDKPHFDFHFYMISAEEQMAIPAYEEDSTKFLNYPGEGYMPENYVPTYGGVPQMGTHWVDITSPELDATNPQPFTQTFIYGSYDGKVIFAEPMITLDFLKNSNNFERAIPIPSKFQQTGYYPTKLRISKHDGVTDIILEGLIYKQAS